MLSVIGAVTYKILRNIVSPDKPADMFANLVEALMKHYSPVPLEILERFKFHNQVRRPGELVSWYVAQLHSLSEFCNFGDTLDLTFAIG